MADNNATNNKVDMSAIAFDLAKNAGWNDERGFKQFEKDFVKKFYEVIGLSDIPEEFLNFTKFIDAYSGAGYVQAEREHRSDWREACRGTARSCWRTQDGSCARGEAC